MNQTLKSLYSPADESLKYAYSSFLPRCFSVGYQVALIPFCVPNSHLYENPDGNESNVLAALEKVLSQLYSSKIYKN